MENNQLLTDKLKFIFDTYGLELLNDTTRLNALLSDLMPDNSKERKLICSVLNEGIGKDLLTVIHESDDIQKACIKKCLYIIKTDTWISENAAHFALKLITDSIGICSDVMQTEEPQEKKINLSKEPQEKEIKADSIDVTEDSGGKKNIDNIILQYLKNICSVNNITNYYIDIGENLVTDKAITYRNACSVPPNDEIFIGVDSNIISGHKGFVIASSGLYCKSGKNTSFYVWTSFSNLEFSKKGFLDSIVIKNLFSVNDEVKFTVWDSAIADLIVKILTEIKNIATTEFVNTDNTKSKDLSQANNDNRDIADFLIKVCRSNATVTPFCTINYPINSGRSKLYRKYCNIPENDEIFILEDSSLIEGKKGFVLSSSGLYRKDGGYLFYYRWKDFPKISIKTKGNFDIEIDGTKYSVGNEKTVNLLINLFEEIKQRA